MAPGELAAGLVSRGLDREEAEARAALAAGRPGRAISLDLAGSVERRDEILASLQAMAASPQAAAQLGLHTERVLGDSETDLLEGLDLVMALLRDSARVASGRGAILHADVAQRIDQLAKALGAERSAELVALVDRLRGDLRLNLNKTLVAETILAAVAGGPMAVAL